MELLWKTLVSENTDKQSKQHAYVPKMSAGGNKRNTTLCGKFRQVGEDGKSELFDNMKDGELLYLPNVCKTCLRLYNKLRE